MISTHEQLAALLERQIDGWYVQKFRPAPDANGWVHGTVYNSTNPKPKMPDDYQMTHDDYYSLAQHLTSFLQVLGRMQEKKDNL
jgi:hypothetical protein